MSKIAFMFAGQGAQYVGMGKDLYESSAAAKAVFDMGEQVRPGTMAMCFEGPEEALKQTINTQPCLFLTDLACAKALEEAGISASCAAGFSLGEIPALAYTGALTDEEAFRLVVARGVAMDDCSKKKPGSMVAALKLENSVVEEVCSTFKEVYPVNYNCPGQVSCAGAVEELDAFAEAIKEKGGRAVMIAVSGAFHTPFMADAADVLVKELSGMDLKAPATKLYANRTGREYPTSREEMVETISKQLCNPVRWEDTIRAMYADGVRTFIEVGAGKTLSGLVKKTNLEDVTILNVSDSESLKEVIAAVKGQ